MCETGGARRTWLWGIEKVYKRYLMSAMAHNLGRLMRGLFRMGTPRGLQNYVDLLAELLCAAQLAHIKLWRLLDAFGNESRPENEFFMPTDCRATTVAA